MYIIFIYSKSLESMIYFDRGHLRVDILYYDIALLCCVLELDTLYA